jgi:chromosome partitioning protein
LPATPNQIQDEAEARLSVLIEAAQANGADFLILDTAPNADQTALRAAQTADVVLIPCRAATFDLEAIQATLTLGQLAQKPSFVVLNAIPPRSGIGREASEGLTSQGAKVAPVMLSQRAAFTHGVIDGRTAQEFEPDGKAAEEIGDLYAWLCGIVGMPTCGRVRKAA